MSEAKTARVKLEWSRLLGFDQADPSIPASSELKLRDSRLTKVGQKSGAKFGIKPGIKVGVKGGIKVAG